MASPQDPPPPYDSVKVSDETTPLLAAPASGGPVTSGPSNEIAAEAVLTGEDDSKPIPYLQIFLLCWASMSDGVAFFGIVPIVNEMIEHSGGVPESDVGFWAGAIEAAFSFVQVILLMFYGRLADRIGRKPVLVFSVAGMAGATVMFGFSQSVWQMIMFRCIGGFFAGSTVTVRTMVAENSTSATQARLFSWLMFSSQLAILIGPGIGGGLANPATSFPDVFGRYQFFHDYPYALSTVGCGFFMFAIAGSCLFYLKETGQTKQSSGANGASNPPLSTWEVVKHPGVPFVLYLNAHVAIVALGFTAVNPVFQYTSVPLGGFGFSDQRIALFLAIAGISQGVWMLGAFAPLQKRFGAGGVARGAIFLYTICLAVFPVLNEFLRRGWTTAFWWIYSISYPLFAGVSLVFACQQLFVNNIAPSRSVLATMNALSMTVGSLVRVISPPLFTSVFALGVRSQFLNGHLVWFVLAIVCGIMNFTLFWLPPAAEGKTDPKRTAPETEDTQTGDSE